MNKIILSLAAVAAAVATGGAFAQAADNDPNGEKQLLGLTRHGNHYEYREPERDRGYHRNGPFAFYGKDGRHDGRWASEHRRNGGDRDRDGIRNRRDGDRDGDGIRNNRDSHPDNPRRH